MPALKKTLDAVIADFRIKHGDKYDYSRVEYKNSIEKIEIICLEHGPFFQAPSSHLSGSGCSICGRISMAKKLSKSLKNKKFVYAKVESIK
ncbi:hypothetical protein [Photobacterium indicum]|uniref:DUF723 domain-containing protein n=1 Tax=Photobacterium indicum TaxID=81447 RepID=A0A2T3L3C8_9GAMM|nr:hypothetical protein [Photobacterium indicum]PSV43599.1 hypothetical protein C9J47_22285 [Photobacterium indicum]